MANRFNALGATSSPSGATHLVTAGVGAAVDTLTSITQIAAVTNVGLAVDNTVVHLAGSETITGTKIFTPSDSITVAGTLSVSNITSIGQVGSAILSLSSGNANGVYFGNSIGQPNFAALGSYGLVIPAAAPYTWSSTNNPVASADTALIRVAAGVVGPTDSNGNPRWFQNTAGEATLASAFTDVTGTLAPTNISFPVLAGRSYRITGYLIVSNSTAADGVQFNFNGGNATATQIDVAFNNLGSNVAGTTTATTLAGVINYTTVTGTDRIQVSGTFKCNAAGTLILQAATNTHVSGTLTLAAGSWLALNDTVTR